MKTVVLVVLILVALALGYKTIHDWGSHKEYQHHIKLLEKGVVWRDLMIDSLVEVKARVDTVHAKSEAVAFNWAGRYQRLRDSLKTAGVPDSSTVETILGVTDSTVNACTRALHDCNTVINVANQLLAQKDTVLWAKDSIIGLERKKHPGRFGCAAGVAANQKGVGLGGACGVRVSF